MKYRAEIDGLRAVAVLAVVLYHAKLGFLAGGYLGVDVFFVISGFLITKNILNEQIQGQFSLANFYQRRARRILPVLFLMLLLTSYYAWQYLLPSDLMEYAGSVLATLGFVSNVFFYFQDNYHAAESATKPLLHTWSLGVEEQFYLLFPILLIALAKVSASRRLAVIWVLAGISLCFAQYASSVFVEFNFYLLPTRLWELAAGALLAVYEIDNTKAKRRLNSSVIAIAGLLMIGISLLIISSDKPHPSLLTLAPIMGSVAIIGWGKQCRYTVRILGNTVMAWIGRLSYSIYLWHFPVFAFAHIKSNEQGLALYDRIELLLIVLILSIIGHYSIEKPFRQANKVGPKVFTILLLCVAISLGAWSYYVIKHKGVESRLGDIESIFDGADRNDSYLIKDGKRCFFRPWNPRSCRFERHDDAISLINIGDSHANMLSVPLHDFAKSKGYNFYNMILGHCPYVIDAWRNTGFKTKCETSQMAKVREYFKSIPPAIIVYTVRWPMYLNAQQFDNGEGGRENSLFFPLQANGDARSKGITVDKLIIDTFNELGELGHTVVLVYPTPEVGWHVPKLIKERLDSVASRPLGRKRSAFEKLNITTSYEVYKKRTKHTKSILDRITNKNVYRVYPEKFLCSDSSGRCATHNKEKIFYYDDDHLSQAGGRLLVAEIERKISLVIDQD